MMKFKKIRTKLQKLCITILLLVSQFNFYNNFITEVKAITDTNTYIESSTGNASYAGSAITVDPSIVVDLHSMTNVTGAKVMIGTGFTSGDTLSYADNSGTFTTDPTATYTSSNGILTFTGTYTSNEWQAIFRDIKFTPSSTSNTDITSRVITFTLGTGLYFNSHYYKVVSGGTYKWADAVLGAKNVNNKLFGLQGYLVTITSTEENTFIKSKISADSWIGASDWDFDSTTYTGYTNSSLVDTSSAIYSEYVWRWVTGPEAEAGTIIGYQGTLSSETRSGSGIDSTVSTGNYNNFNPTVPEPNGGGAGESFGEFYSATGYWNDLNHTTTLSSYIIEYGGMTSDPTVVLSASKTVDITSYQLTYNANGGSGTAPSQTSYRTGTSITIPSSTLTKNTASVIYWTPYADGSGTKYYAGNTLTLSADTTLYAQYAHYISSSTGNATYSTSAVTIDPNITVDLHDLSSITGAKVIITSGFVSGDTLSHASGTYDSSTGTLSFLGTYTTSQIQTILRAVTFTPSSTSNTDLSSRTITFYLGDAFYNSSNSHYYRIVDNTTSITFAASKTAAESSSYFGLKGYFATYSNTTESSFVSSHIDGTPSYPWIGAQKINSIWTWISGPENGSTISYAIPWGTGEPDNNATSLYIAHRSTNGWADVDEGNTVITGYVVEYGGYSSDPSIVIKASRTVDIESKTLSYNANGATSGSAPSSTSIRTGTSTTTSTNSGSLTKTGYTFAGWNTASDGTGTSYAVSTSITLSSSTVLYAKWTENTYTLTYSANGATSGSVPSSQTVGTTTPSATRSNTGNLAKSLYTFSGWNTASDGSGTSYAEGSNITISAATTLYAKWSEVKYSVSYDANGGTGTVPTSSSNIAYNTSYTVLDTSLAKTGFDFAGWNTSADGTGTRYNVGSTLTVTGDTTLYAQWLKVASSSPSISYTFGGSAVNIDSNFILEGTTLSSVAITINNYVPGDELHYTNTSTITGSYSNGTLILSSTSGVQSAASFQTAVRSVTISSTQSFVSRTINYSVVLDTSVPSNMRYNSANQHFYQLIDLGSSNTKNWEQAKTDAATRSYNGKTGYLVTLTTATEDALIKQLAGSLTGSMWMGFKNIETAANLNSTAYWDGDWRWADGPENGTQFFSGYNATTNCSTATGTVINNQYTRWATGEPNGCISTANIGYGTYWMGGTSSDGTTGAWDDNTNNVSLQYYFIEYGGLASDLYTTQSTVTLTGVRTVLTISQTSSTETTTTITFSNLDSAYTSLKYAMIPHGTTAPTSAEIIAGQYSSGASFKASGTLATSGTSKSATISNLASHFLYDVYAVQVDSNSAAKNMNVTASLAFASTIRVAYDFNNNITDITGKERALIAYDKYTNTSAVGYTDSSSGVIKESYYFDGTRVFTLPNNIIQHGTNVRNPFTVSFYFKTTSSLGVGLLGYNGPTASTISTYSTVDNFIPILSIARDGKLHAVLWKGDGDLHVVTSYAVNDGEWHKVTLSAYATPTNTATDTLDVYVDGVQIAKDSNGTLSHVNMTNVTLGTGYAVARFDSASKYDFSSNIVNGWFKPYVGYIDELIIVDGGMTQSQIQEASTDIALEYVLNGGTNPSGTQYLYSKTATSAYTLPTPTKTNYSFAGWYLSSDFSGSVQTSVAVGTSTNQKYYAKWTEITHTLTYNSNGSTSGSVPTSATVGEVTNSTVSTNSGTLAKTHYTFAGWNTLANGKGTNYAAGTSITLSSDLTLYAKWTEITHTLSYNANGSTSGSVPISTSVGEVTTSPVSSNSGTLAKTHYTFAGWNTAADGSGTTYSSGSSITLSSDTTLYAKWTEITHTLTYNSNGSTSGSVPTSATVGEVTNSTVSTNSGNLSKTHYTFEGWNTLANGSGTTYSTSSSITLSSDLTLYAKWVEITHTLTYNANGADAGSIPVSSVVGEVTTSTVSTNSGNLDKSHYIFAGWNTAADGSGTTYSTGSTIILSADQTLYAVWTPVNYTLTFNSNSADTGTVPASFDITYLTNGTVSTNSGNLTKAHYTFEGWNTQADGSGTTYTTGSSISLSANTTLYALWSRISYTINYNSNNPSSGTVPSDITGTNVSIALNSGNLSKNGYSLSGWNTASNYTGTFYKLGQNILLENNMTLYAQYTLIKNDSVSPISYRSSNGFITSYLVTGTTSGAIWGSDIYTDDSSIAVAAVHAGLINVGETAYVFVRMLPGLSSYTSTTQNGITSSSYSSWGGSYEFINKVTAYKLSYDGNGYESGSVPNDTSLYLSNQSATLLRNTNNLAKFGYDFAGWNTNADGTGTALAGGDAYVLTGNKTVYAQWTLTDFTITYNANTATSGTSPSNQAITYLSSGSVSTNSGNLVKTHFEFAGWNTQADGSGTSYLANANITLNSNITLYAQWRLVDKTVTYNSNGGSNVAYEYVAVGNSATQPSNPTKTGYSFVGWYTTSGLNTAYNFTSTISSDMTLYAKWAIAQNTVSFESNGGSFVNPLMVNYNSSISEPTAPTKTGFAFAGWYTNSNLTTPYNFSNSVTNTLTLYAKWITRTYTVNFVDNTDESTVANQTISYLGQVTKPSDPVKTNYVFKGWYKDANFSSPYDFVSSQVTANLTLYAYFVPDTLFNFDSNYGSYVAGQNISIGQQATEPIAPTRLGYTFNGWYTDSNLTNLYNFTSAVNTQTTVYAGWTIQSYNVTFDTQGGSGSFNSQSIQYGNLATSPSANPTKTNSNFMGWSTDPNTLTLWDFTSNRVYQAVTLYAFYSSNNFTIFYKDNRGTTLSTQEVTLGNTINVPERQIESGYRFTDWNQSYIPSTQTFVMTPVFEPIQVDINSNQITFQLNNTFDVVKFSDAELENEVSIRFDLDVLSAQDVNASDKTAFDTLAITELPSGIISSLYIDMNLFRTVDAVESQITETTTPLQISFVVPVEYRSRVFELIRVHNGVAEVLNYTYDSSTYTVTFETTQFSTYGLTLSSASAYRVTESSSSSSSSTTSEETKVKKSDPVKTISVDSSKTDTNVVEETKPEENQNTSVDKPTQIVEDKPLTFFEIIQAWFEKFNYVVLGIQKGDDPTKVAMRLIFLLLALFVAFGFWFKFIFKPRKK